MATKTDDRDDPFDGDDRVDPDHDAFVRAKVERGLAQCRERSTMIPIEQIWRDLAR